MHCPRTNQRLQTPAGVLSRRWTGGRRLYSSSVTGTVDDTLRHHDNSFWHYDARRGESQLRIQIGSPEHPMADDWACKPFFAPEIPPACSRVSVQTGSEIERLLGASARDDPAAFNHLEFNAIASLLSYD